MQRASCLLVMVVLCVLGGCCRSRGAAPRCLPQPMPEGPFLDPATGAVLPEAEPSHPDRKLEAQLARKRIKGLAWEALSLAEALAYVRTIAGVNVFVTPAARKAGADSIEITLKADEISVADLLGILTSPHGLRWGVEDEIVFIRAMTERDRQVVVQIHSIGDLVGEAHHQWISAEMAAHEIMLRVQPEYWVDEQHVIKAQGRGALVIRASSGIQDEVALFLDRERAERAKRRVPGSLARKLEGERVSLKLRTGSLADVMGILPIKVGRPIGLDPKAERSLARATVEGMDLQEVELVALLEILGHAAGPGTLWIERNGVLYLTKVDP